MKTCIGLVTARDCLNNTKTWCMMPGLDKFQSQRPVYDDMKVVIILIFKHITRYLT